jgi:hypothetical protein
MKDIDEFEFWEWFLTHPDWTEWRKHHSDDELFNLMVEITLFVELGRCGQATQVSPTHGFTMNDEGKQ